MALWCAARGWPVHPLAPGRKTPTGNCGHCREDRHPPRQCPCITAGRPCHGFHAATTDPERLKAWWQADRGRGVGVACGPARLVVIDVDAHATPVPSRTRLLPGIHVPDQIDLAGLCSGFDTLALLAAYRGRPDPVLDTRTLRVRTPSGGLHVWYRDSTAFRSSTGSGSQAALAWQVDVRAHGGYIVAPTTRTTAGTYTPLPGARLPAPLPDWLAAELTRTGHHIRTPPPGTPAPQTPSRQRKPRAAARALAPLVEEVIRCAGTPAGAGFTEKLNRAAYTAGGLVAAGHLSERDARSLLDQAAAAARPHQGRRNDDIISASLRAGTARPFHLEGRP
ncbi:bifunctional DNA primase/polymerase (plasmid) [Kitasatospora sp. NBC_00070]|uniref:bifunctional DNA primase/polymerase n=1 Tax=Kitasatospora sp. NBC_00070 TaxID=2975962 RepID=UPI003252F052